MKTRGRLYNDRVHINFKVAVIAILFFFLLFELHSPLFKPATTGYVPTSLGHEKFDEGRMCPYIEGKQLIRNHEEEKECTYWDSLTEKISTINY